MIIDDPSPHKLGARRTFPSPKHESSTSLAERVGHLFAGTGSLFLGEYGEVVFSSGESDVVVESGKVGCEHGCRDFSTVGAMAYESVGESGFLERLYVRCALAW